jgi:hypothetical protein
VDLQNGPDNLQVVWAGSVVVDALGYDTFAADDNWAGEGDSYEDHAPDAAPVDGVMFCLSRGVDHADTDINVNDFYRRTLNNCSPGWEGPGAIVAQAYGWGGWSTPAFDSENRIWTVDDYGDINVTSPDSGWTDGAFDGIAGTIFQSSVAIDIGADPNVAYVGADDGVHAYTITVTGQDPFAFTLDPVAGWPVLSGVSVQATPAISLLDGAVFVGTHGDGFYGFNANGIERFHYETGGAWVDSSAAIGYLENGDEIAVFGVGGNSGEVVAVCTRATGSATCANAGDVLWSDASPTGGCNGSPAISEGQVFIACDDGLLYGYELATGTPLTGLPIDITNGGSDPNGDAPVDSCSPVAMPDGNGNTLIAVTSRSDAGNLYRLSYDGTEVSGVYWDTDTLMSSPALGADLSMVVHMGSYLLNYGLDNSLQWYAVVNDDDPLHVPDLTSWALSSPTWVPVGADGFGYVLVVDPSSGWNNVWIIQATSPPGTVAGSHPMLHADWNNSGSSW